MRNKKIQLKIAEIASLAERVPPKKYGGTERVIYALIEELVKRGHRVTLFASGDSKTSAELISVFPRSLHDHHYLFSLPTVQFVKTPTVITIHGPFTLKNKRLFEIVDKPKFVTISKAQSAPVSSLKLAGTVYNGLNLKAYPFSKNHKGYLLFVGRISMDKGVHYAIDVAHYLNLPLIIAAKLDRQDMHYFNEYIEPRLSNEDIRWIGEVDEEKRNLLMSEALCLLYPVTWREPFGLAMVEAMACGCPVVAFNRGSIPEIVVDGKTGFVVSDIEEMIEAVLRIDKIDRTQCRQYALENFNAEIMTDRYEEIYMKLVGK